VSFVDRGLGIVSAALKLDADCIVDEFSLPLDNANHGGSAYIGSLQYFIDHS
jgi:hypothetical protein